MKTWGELEVDQPEGRVSQKELEKERNPPGCGLGQGQPPPPHTPLPVAQGLSPGQSGSLARGERLREGGRGRCRAGEGFRSAAVPGPDPGTPGLPAPPGGEGGATIRNRCGENIRLVSGGGGVGARETKPGCQRAPSPRCWRLQLPAPPPPLRTRGPIMGGKASPGWGGGAQPWRGPVGGCCLGSTSEGSFP